MKVCLVGNGLMPQWCGSPAEVKAVPNHSATIDGCDVVVRCNVATQYYRGQTGWRTDVLIVRSASGPHGRRITREYDLTIPGDVATAAKRVIVLGDTPDDYPASAIGAYLWRYGWPKDRCEFWPYLEYEPATRAASGVPQKFVLTLGLIALQWIFTTYPDAEILIAGFAFQPIATAHEKTTHDWQAERDWITSLDADGKVRLLT